MSLKYLFGKKSISLVLQDVAAGYSDENRSSKSGLVKTFGTADLVAFGIAIIVGAGIFSTIGNAAYWAGPGVILLCIFMAVACGCAALCYAEFASRVPVSGSAYTYSYVALGEIVAWIIGWDLLMEYTIAASTVSISWSEYFTSLLAGYGMNFPEFLSVDYFSASRGAERITRLLGQGYSLDAIRNLPDMAGALKAYEVWSEAPSVFGLPLICDMPAFFIVAFLTALACIGIKGSKRVSNGMVILKVATIVFVIVAGALYVKPQNWNPFAPNGIQGILRGASGVFFAYLGFDAISTTAEECRNPQHDLPRGIILSLLICTFLYVALALVLTGVVNYRYLQVGDPLAVIFGASGVNSPWLAGAISASAVVTMASVILALIIAQPRVMMSMSRDGLLPPIFSSIHPRFRTPWISTVLTGLVIAIPAQIMSLAEVIDLCSIGTLFAFVLVCGGVLLLEEEKLDRRPKFKLLYIDSHYIFTPALLIVLWATFYFKPELLPSLWQHPGQNLHLILFGLFSSVMAWASYAKRLSLIPVVGLEICMYLMTELGSKTWIRFGVWLAIGLLCYFVYGRKHSVLSRERAAQEKQHTAPLWAD